MRTTADRKLSRLHIYSPKESKLKLDEDFQRGKIVFLAGPTGCGKTDLSLQVAEAVDGEIISADSMQVYRGMDIGTAKATLAQRSQATHHMIDVRDVSEPFNVVDFYYEAQAAIERVRHKGKVPLIVGGAGFYMHALLYGPPAGPPSVDDLRIKLQEQMEKEGAEAMYAMLQEKDPDYASTITPGDRQKIIRALEIITLTGFSVSSLSWKSRAPSLPSSFRCWFLFRPREVLYQRVEERCELMLKEGFLDEVRRLEKEGLRDNRSASQAIGYRQALEFLDSAQSDEDYAQFVENFKKASRHYVKRQFTWFRKEPLFKWLDVDEFDQEAILDLITKDCKLF